MRFSVLSVQLARAQLGIVPLVMRRWLASDRRLRFVVAACWRAEGASRRWVMSEPYDVCLCRLAQSPVTGLTSMDWGREVAFGPPLALRISLVSSRPAASGYKSGYRTGS